MMAFAAKISWRFRYLNTIGYMLKERFTKIEPKELA